jgi:hypothetical protein
MADAPRTLRVANISGFYGDRLSAAREMLEGGAVDVLTGDYLAELTLLILHKARQKQPHTGYALSFLRQMEEVLGLALDRGVRVVTNAGGLNPAGLAEELRKLAARLGLSARVAHVAGDDLLGRLPELQARGHALAHLDRGIPLAQAPVAPVSANVYLGGWGIAEALRRGADLVVCPRVSDASLVVGPAAWHFGFAMDDWDRLAGAVVAGHLLECGPQVTGGNYAFFLEVPSLRNAGFPIAELEADGSFVVTKHPGSEGLVSVGTVTAQLLYEIAEPAYRNPDVIARFDTISLEQVGPDRVRVSGVRGEPAPADLKVCINYAGGWRNTMTFVLTGLDIEAKAELARETLLGKLGGAARFDAVDVQLIRNDRPDARTNDEASAFLQVTVKDRDPGKVGRAFSDRVTEMALSSYPGLYTTTPPTSEREFGVYWPALVPAEEVREVVVLDDGTVVPIPHPPRARRGVPVAAARPKLPQPPAGPCVRVPLGAVFGARSGDKGGNANVGVWARSPAAYAWLASFLTAERFRELVPEVAGLEVRRFELPNVLALNFVVVGLLGEGVASSVRRDPQAKSLGEFLRSRVVDLPEVLLADRPAPARSGSRPRDRS